MKKATMPWMVSASLGDRRRMPRKRLRVSCTTLACVLSGLVVLACSCSANSSDAVRGTDSSAGSGGNSTVGSGSGGEGGHGSGGAAGGSSEDSHDAAGGMGSGGQAGSLGRGGSGMGGSGRGGSGVGGSGSGGATTTDAAANRDAATADLPVNPDVPASWMPRLNSGQPHLSRTARLHPSEVGRKATGIIARAKTACSRVATWGDRRMLALHFFSAERRVGLEAWRPTHLSRLP